MTNLQAAQDKLEELSDLLGSYTFASRDYKKARRLLTEAKKLLEKEKP